MENICQSLGKNSDKMAKGPFQSADFDGNGEFCENCENRQALDISQREKANVVPFESGGFDENGIFGEHSPSS